MSNNKNFISLFRENKIALTVIIVVLFLIEVQIFAVAFMKSGKKSWIQVIDKSENIIYETDGKNLSDFNKYYFEKTFGPLENYKVKLVTNDIDFPFRAWFASAIGIPIGVVLLLGFIIKAYFSLFYGNSNEEKEQKKAEKSFQYDNVFEKVIGTVTQFNIFVIGFLIFLAVILYWTIPSMLTYLGKVGIETIFKFKWFIISVIVAIFGFFVWIVYLRYLLAKKSMDNQFEFDKYRYSLEYHPSVKKEEPLQINHQDNNQIENQENKNQDIKDQSQDNQDSQDNDEKLINQITNQITWKSESL